MSALHSWFSSLVLLAALGTIAAPATHAQFLTVGNGSYPGTGDNAFPFGSPTGYPMGGEFQEVFPSNAFAGPTTISGVAFASSSRFSPTSTTYNVTIGLSNTTASAVSPSSSFSANKGGNFTTVFNGTLTASLAENNTFDLNFPTTAFTYDPTQGNLLLDVFVNSATTGGSAAFLVNGSASRSTGRVYQSSTAAAPSTDTQGLYTKFTVQASSPFAEYDDASRFNANTTGLMGGFYAADYTLVPFQQSDNITAVDAKFFAGSGPGYTATIDLYSGYSFTNNFGNNAFSGFVADSAIKDIIIQRIGTSNTLSGSIYYGHSLAATPEPPASVALGIGTTGLTALSLYTRRRNRSIF